MNNHLPAGRSFLFAVSIIDIYVKFAQVLGIGRSLQDGEFYVINTALAPLGL